MKKSKLLLFTILHASTCILHAELKNEDMILQTFDYEAAIKQVQQDYDIWKQKADDIRKKFPSGSSMYFMEFDMEQMMHDYLLLLKQCQKVQKFEPNEKEWTLLLFAVSLGYRDMVKNLLAAGVDVNEKGPRGETALIAASRRRSVLFASCGGALAFASKEKENSLVDNEKETEIIKLLLLAGANVNTRDNFGNTALMWVSPPCFGVFKLLLDSEVDVNIKNNNGKTILEMTSTPEFIELLNKVKVVKDEKEDVLPIAEVLDGLLKQPAASQ